MKIKLPNGWEVKKLKDLGIFIRGVSYKKEQLLNEKDENSVFLLRANNIQSQLNLDELQIVPKELAENKIIQDNDILFAMSSGSKHIVGKNIILKDLNDFSFGAFCGVFRATDESLNPYFLSYYLKSFEYHKYIQGVSKGSNINNLRFKDLEEFQIPLPSLEEQRKIVKILDEKFASIDESIRLVKDDLLSLDELWQSILNDSFNPLKSKLDNDTYTLPPTWKWEKLGEIAKITSGGTPSRSKNEFWENGSIPWVKIKDMKEDYIKSTEEFITDLGLSNSSAKLFPKGTLLYSIFATLGEVGILDINAATNQAIAGITIKQDDINTVFMMYYLKSIKNEVMKKGRGVAQNNLNISMLKELEVPLPSLEEQERIAKELESKAKTIKELKELYTKRLKDYEELKESLLDLAFKGGL